MKWVERSAALVMLSGVAIAGGCAAIKGHAAAPTGPVPAIAGVWEGVSRSTLREGMGAGDTRIERQSWRLTQKGSAVSGFYVVELTMISGDGRPYLCSRQPRFSTMLRFDVRGRASSSGIDLEEVGDVHARGPCRPTFRTPTHFRAALRGDVLTVTDGDRRLPLYRRPAGEQADAERQLLALAESDDSWSSEPAFPTLDGPRADTGDAPTADLAGIWVWEHRGTLPGGDEKVEREEWHLTQDGTRVAGYYDRAIRQVSTDGHPYRCNSALDFHIVTRYQVSGEVRGRLVELYERAFEVIEGSPCDDGRRRLDAYQGEAAPGEIRLMWGVGTQVLKRAHPNVPTQRF